MSSVILTWNNRDLSDLRIVCETGTMPKIFENSSEARDFAEEKFMNFEVVTFYDTKKDD